MGKHQLLRYWRYRLWNGFRKAFSGLTPRGESVWPGARNDLFLAHASIYGFFAQHADGKDVLDAGCGAGYGSARLGSVARSVLGVDLDPRSIRYASRHHAQQDVHFQVANCEALELLPDSFDLIVSSNMMEHLERPERFLDSARRMLRDGGRLLIAVPPITAPELLSDNEANPFHRTNLSVDGWIEMFEKAGWASVLVRHSHPQMFSGLDFATPWPSETTESEFAFSPATRDEIYALGTLTAIFVLDRAC